MRKLLAVSFLALSACATTYHSDGYFGGFDDVALAPNVYRVSFRGNGYTSSARAEDMALLRSADLTLQKGFRYFALADARSSLASLTYTTPTQSSTRFMADRVGNHVMGSAYTTTTGGQTFIITKPSTTNIVVMFAEKPNGVSFDAGFLCFSMGLKYKIECGKK
jgi:hypothetical protein